MFRSLRCLWSCVYIVLFLNVVKYFVFWWLLIVLYLLGEKYDFLFKIVFGVNIVFLGFVFGLLCGIGLLFVFGRSFGLRCWVVVLWLRWVWFFVLCGIVDRLLGLFIRGGGVLGLFSCSFCGFLSCYCMEKENK